MNKTTKIFILVTIGLLIFPTTKITAQEMSTVEPVSAEPLPFEELTYPEGARDIIPKEPSHPGEKPIIITPIIMPIPVGTGTVEPTGVIEEPIMTPPPPTEKAPVGVSEAVTMDENITAEDLRIAESGLLPTSPYYPIKNIFRAARTIFTFNLVEKAKLKLQFANERLIEAKKVAEQVDRPKVVARALENYKKEMADVTKIVEKMPERINVETEDFAEKIINDSFNQQKLIDGIEKNIGPEYFERINKVREGGIENFAQTITKLIPTEEIQGKIAQVMDEQEGSEFKNFKNLEILKAVEEKVPEVARYAIQQAQGNAMERLHDNITTMTEEKREKFKEYVDHVGGNEIRHLEIIQDFAREEMPEIIREEMEKAKEIAIQRIEKQMKELEREEQKEEFLHHLETGEMEDLRIIKELENNLAPETIEKILEIKNKALDNFRQDFEKLETPEEQERFLEKIEELHDVKQFEVFKEIEQVIPEEQKEFFEEMKDKAMQEMKNDINNAEDMSQRAMIIEKLAGDTPEHIEIIKEFGPPPEILNEILKEQVEKLSKKIQTTQDIEKIQILKERIAEEDMIREELEKRAPDIFRQIETKFEQGLENIKQDKAAEQLEKAKIDLVRAEKDLTEFLEKKELSEHLRNSPASVLVENAKKHITNAEKTFDEGKYGQAFGQATAVMSNANNVWRIIKEVELREKIAGKRIEKMEEMMGDMDIDQFLIEPRSIEAMELTEEVRVVPRPMEIELPFEKMNLSDEKIKEIREITNMLPQEIQLKLKNIPVEMLPEAMEKLNFKIEEIRHAPSVSTVEEIKIKRSPASTNIPVPEKPVGLPNPAEKPTEERPSPVEPDYPSGGAGGQEKCQPVCKAIGTRSEGWHDSCTGELIEFAKCEGQTTPGSGFGQSEPAESGKTTEGETWLQRNVLKIVPGRITELRIKTRLELEETSSGETNIDQLKSSKPTLKIQPINPSMEINNEIDRADGASRPVPSQTIKLTPMEVDGNGKVLPEGSIGRSSVFQKVKSLFTR